MNQPLVSIIIPTYNRAHLIRETLDSVLVQTYTNWECIVVDDGSTDGTEELLKTYIAKDSRIQFHKRPDIHLPGGNGARNYGFKMSKGEFVHWFDDDDVMLPEMLSTNLLAFENDTDLVVCSCIITTADLKEHKKIDLKVQSYLFKAYCLRTIRIVTNNIVFRKNFLENRELFLENLLRGQEAEFFSRLFFKLPEHTYKIVNQPLFLYRQHNSTKTTLDKSYNFRFKSSHFYVQSENLKRGFIIKDDDIIYSIYKKIISLLIEAINNHDKKLIKNILDYFKVTIEWYHYLVIRFIALVLRKTQIMRYTLKKIILNLRIKIKQ